MQAVRQSTYRIVRVLVVPLAWRFRAFLTGDILAALRSPETSSQAASVIAVGPAAEAARPAWRRLARAVARPPYRVMRHLFFPLARHARGYMSAEVLVALRQHLRQQARSRTFVWSRLPDGRRRRPIRIVHQFHAGSASGDAITNGMILTRTCLRQLGFESDIFVEHRASELAGRLRTIDELPSHSEYVLLVHHSAGYHGFDRVAALAAPKVLVYHNITPPELFPDNPYVQDFLRLGRVQLKELRAGVTASIADSEYNALELRGLGFDPVYECPMLFDIDALLAQAAAKAPRPPGAPFTVLFVGRVVESKAQADLVDAFAAFSDAFDLPCRLVLVGRLDGDGRTGYPGEIRRRAASHGIDAQVLMTGQVCDADLSAWYDAADLYVSLSHHEGFGVPLVEAMAHDIPVAAWPAGAVPYLVEGAGELLTDRDPDAIATAMLALARDAERRTRIIARQRQRLVRFQLKQQVPTLISALALAGAAPPGSNQARRLVAANMHFAVTGHVNGTYSLAVVNRTVAFALESQFPGRVRLLPVEGAPVTDLTGVPPEHQAATVRLVGRPKPPTGPTVMITQHYPVYIPPDPGDLTVAMVFWEESLLPAATVDTLNHGCRAVLAPSGLVAKALIDSGVSIPVTVSGYAPELDRFLQLGNEREKSRPAPGLPFTFFHVSSCFPRKGVDVLIKSFARAFRRGDPVRLIIKGFPNPHNDIAGQLHDLLLADPDVPDIALIDTDVGQERLIDLYRNADAVVLPTRGEGFNMPAAEAMAAGIPLIVTGYGGHLAFCTADEARFIDYRFESSRSHISSPHSLWVEPDADDLVAALRELFAARDQADGPVAARRAKARVAVRARLDPAGWARRVGELCVDLLLAPPAPPPRLVWVSSWEVRCGVAEHSSLLLEPLLAADDALAARTVVLADDRTPASQVASGARVRPCWRTGEDDTERLAAAIASEDPDILVIQHQPGLISWPSLSLLLADHRLRRCHVVVSLHAALRLLEISEEERAQMVRALAGASRIIVHSIADINFLKTLGLVDTVTLLPLGVTPPPTVPEPRVLPPDAVPVIACYGFFLPGKGIPRLIEAVPLLRRTWPQLRLRLVNAEYPHQLSAEEMSCCRGLVAQLGLDDVIEWHSEFLPHQESLSLLASSDLIVLPYDESKESASAAVRSALGSGIPVATSPIRLFAELDDAVARLANSDGAAFAEDIRRLLADVEARRAIQRSAAAWMVDNSWQRLSRRLHGLLMGLHVTAPRRQERVSQVEAPQ